MYILKDTFDFTVNHDTVITLGKFDGVHRGHQALIDRVLQYAGDHHSMGKTPKTVVFAFMMNHNMLLNVKERRELLKNKGIDILVECPFVPLIITMEAEDFVRKILGYPEKMKIEAILSIGNLADRPEPYKEEELRMDKVHFEKY